MSKDQKVLEFHPLADLFPPLGGDDFDALIGDIKAHGLQKPVTLHEGKIRDGRNRYRACREAGVAIRTEEYAGDDALGFVISANLRRRHLDESQRAMIADKIADMAQGQRTDLQPSANLRKVGQPEASRMLKGISALHSECQGGA